MTRITSLLKLDFILLIRNRIVLVAAVITALYAGILQVLPDENFNMVITTLIFTDPVMLGFIFIGVMVLFEKGGNTLQAISVSPVRSGEYLWSKALSLTLVSIAAALIMTLAGVGFRFQPIYLILAITFSSLLFIFIGFVGVSWVKTFNQYFVFIPIFITPAFLPFLNYFGITDTWLVYLIPTQASLILFVAAFDGTDSVSTTDIIYSIIYALVSIWGAYIWAMKSWNKNLRS
jgi:fluoroquinolone transport system permease protein